jgi:hypothetical protein
VPRAIHDKAETQPHQKKQNKCSPRGIDALYGMGYVVENGKL